MYSVDCIQNLGASLGESPIWSCEEELLYWIDINNRLIHQLNPQTGKTRKWHAHTEIGCIGLAGDQKLIAGLRDGFYYFSPSSGTFDFIVDPEPDKPENRLNDGKVDRVGRMWCGSMQDPNPSDPVGALYRLSSADNCHRILDGIRIPNAISWSPNNKTMYFSDTRASIIWAFDFSLNTGAMTNKRIFVDLSQEIGRPDGATVDEEGYLWNAEYGGSRVVRYTPDGEYDRQIDLPVTNVTCCTFGGSDLSTLYITTASQRLSAIELAEQPLAGGLFACEVDIKGLPEPYFAENFNIQ